MRGARAQRIIMYYKLGQVSGPDGGAYSKYRINDYN